MPEYTALSELSELTGCKETVSPKPLSLLELFHPGGAAQRSLVIGNNCPTMLLPLYCGETAEDADLVILAPTTAECLTNGWLQKAVQSVSQRLRADGVAYVLSPARWRLSIRNLLYDHGLSIEETILHLPDQGSSRYLIPLSPRTAQYAISDLLALSFSKRFLAAVGIWLLGFDERFKCLLPSVGLLVRRPGARPILEWLFRLNSETSGSALITTGSRGKAGSVVVHCFLGGEQKPSAVAKIIMTPTDSLIEEAATLNRLGSTARAAGAQVPRIRSLDRVNGHPILLQTALCGQSIGAILTSQPGRLFEIMEGLVLWLESWNGSTMRTMPMDRELLKREILAPASLLKPLLEHGNEYHWWLKARCCALAGASIPLVASHNDLTMWNMLLGEQGRIGVVDWESARENGLPLVDFFYAMADAVTIARGYTDRSKAFKACFVAGGTYARMVSQFATRLRRIVQMPDEMVEFCFHACWLHHAANEHQAAGPSDPRPFLEIVQWLALNRSCVGRWLHG